MGICLYNLSYSAFDIITTNFLIMLDRFAEILCGYPLFFLLIGGGLYLFISSGFVSLRRLPHAIRVLRSSDKDSGDMPSANGQISSAQALASVVAATIGLGNIAGVAIALVVGGPGAIFWMWVSALVGMATKYHEGVLSVMYRRPPVDGDPSPRGGTMYVIRNGLHRRWRWAASLFAVAGMFGTLCIMNSNQLTEAVVATFTTPESVESHQLLSSLSSLTSLSSMQVLRLCIGIGVSLIVALVVLGGLRRIAAVASVLVPFMVGVYFIMVLYIIVTHFEHLPSVFTTIFSEAFNIKAGVGSLIGIAIIGARRAALVNDAGVGTAGIMHGSSSNTSPVREGLIAMLGPSVDSGLVCTLTALAIMLALPSDALLQMSGDIKGLEVATKAFSNAIPYGEYFLMACFALSSMFSYSYYGASCARYLFGPKRSAWYTYIFIATIAVFAVVPLGAAVALCDIFYALMAIPTMITVIALSGRVRAATKKYFTSR